MSHAVEFLYTARVYLTLTVATMGMNLTDVFLLSIVIS